MPYPVPPPPLFTKPSAWVRRGWLFAAALCLLAFFPAVRYPLLLDDALLVEQDIRIRPPFDCSALLFTPVWPDQFPPQPLWRPAFHLSLALNRLLTGPGAWGFHLVNILLHACVAALLWHVARRLGASHFTATFAAALFALHPVHTEAVVGIVGRAELQMTLGTLLVVLFGLEFARNGRLRHLLFAAAAYGFALSSKEQGYLAPLFLALAWGVARKPEARSAEEPSPSPASPGGGARMLWLVAMLGAVAVFGVGMRLQLFGFDQGFGLSKLDPLDNPLVEASVGDRIGTALRLFGRAIGLLLLPATLSADYSAPGITLGWEPLGFTALSGISVLLLLVLAWALWRKTAAGVADHPEDDRPALGRIAVAGIAWTLLAYLPTSNLLVLNGTLFGERLLYLPSAGACLALGVVAARMRIVAAAAERDAGKARRLQWLAAAGLIVLGLSWCWRAQQPWRSSETLYRHAVLMVPYSAKARYGWGLALLEEGEYAMAQRQFALAVGLWPRYAKAWHQLGLLELESQNPIGAEGHFREALRLDPWLAESHNSLGNALALRGRPAEALLRFEHYRRLAPADAKLIDRKIEYTKRKIRGLSNPPPPAAPGS